MNPVTIGFAPRERFSLAAESLQSILENTRVPFELVVVNCAIPDRYWRPMQELLRGRRDVKVLEHDRFLLPNQAKNRILSEASGEWLCLIENDNLVPAGWLQTLIRACEEHPADVGIPLIMEGRPGKARVHFDDGLGFVDTVETTAGPKRIVRHRRIPKEQSPGAVRRTEEFMETHCLLFRRPVFDRIGPFDEKINTSEEVDLSLAIREAGLRAVFEPACVIHYVLPSFPLEPEDRDYFALKWDVEQARSSHRHIQQKWDLASFPQTIGFVMERALRGAGGLDPWREELLGAIDGSAPIVLVDDHAWTGTAMTRGLRTLPYTEREGRYWGPPADDEAAVAEVERLREEAGARAIVFGWHTVWYLQHYRGLDRHLRTRYRCALENDHLVAFDLGAGPDPKRS